MARASTTNTSGEESSGFAATLLGAAITLNWDCSNSIASENKPALFWRRRNSPLALVKTTSLPIGTATPSMGFPFSSRTCPRITYFGALGTSATLLEVMGAGLAVAGVARARVVGAKVVEAGVAAVLAVEASGIGGGGIGPGKGGRGDCWGKRSEEH